jgi:S-adenosylmethionine decarboxylase
MSYVIGGEAPRLGDAERRGGKMSSRPAPRQDTAPWGLLTSLDIYDCNPEIIRDSEKIKKYVIELCDLIRMKRFGDCQLVHFGKEDRVEGYTMVQLIETSHVSGHFANLTNAAYIDIFSCKPYEPDQVARFSTEFFQAESFEMHVVRRI